MRNAKGMIDIRNSIGGASKIVASGVNQQGVDIDAVEKFWREEIGVDNFIKRKFLTWGVNTSLDGSRSADPSPYLDTDNVPCPFIFERLNIDSRGNVMVCGYDIAANTSMGLVTEHSIKDIWHGEASAIIAKCIWRTGEGKYLCAPLVRIGNTVHGTTIIGRW
ncbi:SPASM domain-containing protein [Methylogaea oryzae]|uniref:SPASM domain-containing protein n=1 Tax=Methylogaea oryzae TaxID=1295382 RepID=UPI001C3F4A10|nr:SPASM domain-containing protein [Methylogaea oryzae]